MRGCAGRARAAALGAAIESHASPVRRKQASAIGLLLEREGRADPADAEVLVVNPERKRVDRLIAEKRKQLAALRAELGDALLDEPVPAATRKRSPRPAAAYEVLEEPPAEAGGERGDQSIAATPPVRK